MSSVLYANSDHTHKYLNLVIENTSEKQNIPASSFIERGGNIVDEPQLFLLSIDRFFINYSIFPIWQPVLSGSDTELGITLLYTSSGNTYPITVQSSKPQLYSFQEVCDLLNTALSTATSNLNSGESVTLNAPSFSFQNNLFSLSSDSAFRSDVQLFFNQTLTAYLSTLEYATINPASFDQFGKVLLNADKITQSVQTCEQWSPLQKIICKSTLPILSEYTPERNSTTSFSSSSEPILTDFVIYPETGSPFQLIDFSASGNHRWISMSQSTNFDSFQISFFWSDKQGVERPVILPPKAVIEMKLLFKRIDSNKEIFENE